MPESHLILLLSFADRINCHSIFWTIDWQTNAAKGAEPINLYENCVSTHGSEVRSWMWMCMRMRMQMELQRRSRAKCQREMRTTTWVRRPLWIYGELQCNFRNMEELGSRLEDEIE